MASKSYPYWKAPPDIFKPWVPVRLGNPSSHKVVKKQMLALIDSGADFCLVSEDIAAYLGAMITDENKKEYRKLTTANSETFEVYKIFLDLYICDTKYKCPFYVSDELPRHAPIILGQVGFFNHFKVEFDLRNRQINISS